MYFCTIKVYEQKKVQRKKSTLIKEVFGNSMSQFIGADNAKRVEELRAIRVFESIYGNRLKNYIIYIELKNGNLVIALNSSIVRQEIMLNRESIKTKLNSEIGKELIKTIELR